MSTSEVGRFRANLDDELNAVALYNALAGVERDPKISEVYRRMAAVEQRHAEVWIDKLRQAGVDRPPFHPSWRTHTLIWLARRFGVRAVLPSIAAMEQEGDQKYARQPDAVQLVPDERSHARLLRQITLTTPGGLEGGTLAQLEGRHRATGGNALRAAVLGANDGLVSNLSLVMGVAGAALSHTTILITGVAGLLAGACSMALGEWLSVQSSRELYQRQINIEREELASAPHEELEELALIYQAKGLEEAQARRLATQMMENHSTALETLTREELGIDPKELGGSAWVAAITSFVLFAAGALIPVLPYGFLGGGAAMAASIACSLIGLFVIGAGITLFTGRSVLRSGIRQVAFGLTAAGITFLIGRLIGVSLAG